LTASPASGGAPEAAPRALPEGLVIFGADGALFQVNAAALSLFGLEARDLPPGTTLPDFARLCAGRRLAAPDASALQAAFSPGRDAPVLLRTAGGRRLELRTMDLPQGGWLLLAADATPPQPEHAALLDMAVRHHHCAIAVYDADHALQLYNPAYEQLLELPPGSVLRPGLRFEDLLDQIQANQPPGSPARAVLEERRQADRGRPFEQIRTRDDGRTIRSISRPLPGGGFLLSIDDVTPLHQAQEEASRRAALLDGVLRAMPHGICVYDAEHRLTMVNDAYQRILAGAELQVGRDLMEICRERCAQGEFTNGETPEMIFERQFHFGRPPQERVRRNGTVVASSVARLPDGGHISVVSDVTALHAAEAEAKNRAHLLQVMMDSMRHGVCLFDSQHRVVAANALAATMTGLRPEELAPGTPLDVLRRLQFERGEFGAGSAAERVFVNRSISGVERQDRYTRTRADGTVIEIITDPTPDGGYVRTYADVTEERRAREATERARMAAEQANAAKTRFLATMSHELRTPLNAVIGFSEALAAEPETPHAREFAQTILQAGRHLLSLIDEILEVAKTGADDFHIGTRALFLPSVLESVARLVRGSAEAAKVTLELLPPPPDLPRGLAEERRLRQVLLSLLSNAVKFTPAGGYIRVSAAALPQGGVEIAVADTGIGMSADQLPLAFEPFVQLETSHARNYGGSGLGLYLARTLARAMGAELTLESQHGQGTVARLRLAPATPQQEQTA
jgi:signal transduction histidine kinase